MRDRLAGKTDFDSRTFFENFVVDGSDFIRFLAIWNDTFFGVISLFVYKYENI
jgi:hypothetical protein